MLKIISTAERKAYRSQYRPFIDKHFDKDFAVVEPGAWSSWSESPFYFMNFGLEDGTIASFMELLITPKTAYDNLLEGKTKEHQIPPYTPGANEEAYLYWPTLILENRTHGPYLIKSIFREVAALSREWKINLTHVYSIAFSPVSERILRRYGFAQSGTYPGGYPIMISKVNDNPYLYAFIPNVSRGTHQPWEEK